MKKAFLSAMPTLKNVELGNRQNKIMKLFSSTEEKRALPGLVLFFFFFFFFDLDLP